MLQALELLGALLIIGAFAAQQFGRMDASSALYHALNAVGAGLLAALALHHRQAEFLLLEATWCALSVFSLVTRRRRKAPDARESARPHARQNVARPSAAHLRLRARPGPQTGSRR
jgi:hypothetical protein